MNACIRERIFAYFYLARAKSMRKTVGFSSLALNSYKYFIKKPAGWPWAASERCLYILLFSGIKKF